jgi:hypothetical protein
MTKRKRDARVVGTAAAVGALAWGGLIAAGPAAADTASYLQKLQDAGISTPRGAPELKEWGWEICLLFQTGEDPHRVMEQAVYNSGSRPQYGMTVEQAETLMHIAVTDLCDGRD